jgi:broad specificity polyphosphatase/5'/3'-nucleotidase SurE
LNPAGAVRQHDVEVGIAILFLQHRFFGQGEFIVNDIAGNDRFEKRRDPRNRSYYWPGADSQVFDEDPEVDGAALQGNRISITPIKCDMTDYDALERLRRWRWDSARVGLPE